MGMVKSDLRPLPIVCAALLSEEKRVTYWTCAEALRGSKKRRDLGKL